MNEALLKEFEETFSTNILEAYGLTEATAMVSTNPPHGIRKLGSIGLPYEGIKMRVVDHAGRILGNNQIGEIVLSGPNVFKGYYEDPEATSKTIVHGWLHTGDLGYQDEDGYYFLVGSGNKDFCHIVDLTDFDVPQLNFEEILHNRIM